VRSGSSSEGWIGRVRSFRLVGVGVVVRRSGMSCRGFEYCLKAVEVI